MSYTSDRMQEIAASTMSKSIRDDSGAAACNCVGPQNGEPMCPCAMRNVKVKNGRYIIPEKDLGPVKD